MRKNDKNVGAVHTHTHGILEKNINKIKGRDIYANASNFGITLIALIITIIILLILAGITLNMVVGENGIFGKASTAKNKTEIAQYEEELRMCVLEMQTDSAEKGKNLTLKDIQENFQTEVGRIQNTTEISIDPNDEESITKVTGIYKGYNFEINDKLQAKILEQATGTTIALEIKSEIPKSGYTNKAEDILVTIKNPNGIKKITKKDGNVVELQNNQKSYSIDYPGIDTNRTYTYTVEDSNGNTETKTISVNNIDKLAPKDFEITVENTDKGLKINAKAEDAEATDTDACSGIDRYEYYVKGSTEEKYTKYDTNEINKESGIWNIYVIAYDKAGNSKTSKILENEKAYIAPNKTKIQLEDGTEADAYAINNAIDLVHFREIINNNYGNIQNAALMKDIDMSNVCNKVDGTVASDKSWEPIGNEKIEYNGIFEGNGHTINNIYINSNNSNQGLFGVVGENGKVKNIKINGKIETTGIFAGGITGVNNGTILKCSNNAEMVMNGACGAGGITGANNGTIMKCINQANISSRGETAGGISGFNGLYGTTGIIGECCNYGSIYAGSWNSAGISAACGTHNSGSIGYIFNCYNVGTITGGNGYNGGIVASCGYGGGSSYIYNCYNEGIIVCTQQGGSLIYENIYYTEVDITVDNLNKNSNIVQGLQEKNLYISNAFTSDTSNINNGYPILKWQLNN